MRQNRVIYFDGEPTPYPLALGKLVDHGVPIQAAIRFLDAAEFAMVDDHLAALQKVGSAVKKGAGKIGEAVKKADEALGKTGGGDEDCEWITIKGAKGTTNICIDHEGNIKLGPKGLAGKPADTISNDRQSIDRAKGIAKQKKEEAERREKAGMNKVRDWADRADDLASVAMSFAGGDFAMGMGSMMTKFLAERFGFVKKATNGLRDFMVKRYGQGGATAITLAGMATMKAADLVVPGVGTVMGFVPGGHLISALPVIGVIEACRFVGKEAKHLGSGIKRLSAFLGSHGDPKAAVQKSSISGKARGKGKFSLDAKFAAGKTTKDFDALSDADIEKLGKKFISTLHEKILADWKKHSGHFKKAAAKLKKGYKKGKSKKDE